MQEIADNWQDEAEATASQLAAARQELAAARSSATAESAAPASSTLVARARTEADDSLVNQLRSQLSQALEECKRQTSLRESQAQQHAAEKEALLAANARIQREKADLEEEVAFITEELENAQASAGSGSLGSSGGIGGGVESAVVAAATPPPSTPDLVPSRPLAPGCAPGAVGNQASANPVSIVDELAILCGGAEMTTPAAQMAESTVLHSSCAADPSARTVAEPPMNELHAASAPAGLAPVSSAPAPRSGTATDLAAVGAKKKIRKTTRPGTCLRRISSTRLISRATHWSLHGRP